MQQNRFCRLQRLELSAKNVGYVILYQSRCSIRTNDRERNEISYDLFLPCWTFLDVHRFLIRWNCDYFALPIHVRFWGTVSKRSKYDKQNHLARKWKWWRLSTGWVIYSSRMPCRHDASHTSVITELGLMMHHLLRS